MHGNTGALACGKQPGVMVRAGKQWYLMRVESARNQSTVYGEKIAFCRGCFRPLQQDESSAVPYEFGHDSAFDKQVRLLDWAHHRFKKFGTPTSKAANALDILKK